MELGDCNLSRFNNTPFLSEQSAHILYGLGYVFAPLFSIWIIGGNILTLAALFKFKLIRSHTNMLICSLTCADLMIGVHYLTESSVHLYAERCSEVGLFLGILGTVLYQSSITQLFIIAAERYAAVLYPFKYVTWVTPKRIKKLFMFYWCYHLNLFVINLVVEFPLYTPQNKRANALRKTVVTGINASLYVIGIFVLALLYGRIFLVARRHAKQIQVQSRGGSNFANEMKAAKCMAFVLVAYLLAWGPKYAFQLLVFTRTVHIDPTSYGIISGILTCPGTANSGVNILIYAWQSKEFRNAYKRLLRKGCYNSDSMIETI